MRSIYICMGVCRNKQKSIKKKGQRSGEVRHRILAAIAGPMHENKISCIGQRLDRARCRVSASNLTYQHRPMHRNKSYHMVRTSGGKGSALTYWQCCQYAHQEPSPNPLPTAARTPGCHSKGNLMDAWMRGSVEEVEGIRPMHPYSAIAQHACLSLLFFVPFYSFCSSALLPIFLIVLRHDVCSEILYCLIYISRSLHHTSCIITSFLDHTIGFALLYITSTSIVPTKTIKSPSAQWSPRNNPILHSLQKTRYALVCQCRRR